MGRNEMFIRVALGLVLFVAWLGLTYFPAPNDSTLLAFIQLALGGLLGHSAQSSKGN